MTNHIETELKLYVPDLEEVAERLEEIGAVLTKPRVLETNVRYENAQHSLSPSGIVVRLRKDSRTWLTYKSPGTMLGDNIRSRFEAEVEVGDFATMEKILAQLGYYPHVIYEKYRTTYEIENAVGHAEIVLDEMPYGNFVEIEASVRMIEEVLRQLGLEDAPRMGGSYLQLFENVRQNMRLRLDHLTFESFAGIEVPLSAFENPLGS